MEAWRTVFRVGFAPVLSTAALEALRDALRYDDPALLHGQTTEPVPLMAFYDWPCSGSDLIGYAGWRGEGKSIVGEVDEFWSETVFEAERLLGAPGECRHLLNAWDDMDRAEIRREMLKEIERALAERQQEGAALLGLPEITADTVPAGN